jgi:hypothetical protein
VQPSVAPPRSGEAPWQRYLGWPARALGRAPKSFYHLTLPIRGRSARYGEALKTPCVQLESVDFE